MYGDEQTAQEALDRFHKFVNDEAPLNPDLRSTVYAIVLSNLFEHISSSWCVLQAVREGGEAVYNKLIERYHATELQEEKVRILRSLGYTKSPELAQRTLALAISSDVRSQDTVSCLAGVATNPIHALMAWEFFQANFDFFFARSVIYVHEFYCCSNFLMPSD